MVPKEVYSFLKKLQQNNNRDWFKANKALYQEAKYKFDIVVDMLIHEISGFDPAIKGLQAKDCVFRIYRDVRFSRDKSPYKNNMGAFICKNGRSSGFGGYYIHVEPGSSMLAGGVYMPPSNQLKKIRDAIFNNPYEFQNILEEKTFAQNFGTMEGEQLKTYPKGYPKDFEAINLLKYKSYTVFKAYSDEEFLSEDFFKTAVDLFRSMQPFVSYLNHALEA